MPQEPASSGDNNSATCGLLGHRDVLRKHKGPESLPQTGRRPCTALTPCRRDRSAQFSCLCPPDTYARLGGSRRVAARRPTARAQGSTLCVWRGLYAMRERLSTSSGDNAEERGSRDVTALFSKKERPLRIGGFLICVPGESAKLKRASRLTETKRNVSDAGGLRGVEQRDVLGLKQKAHRLGCLRELGVSHPVIEAGRSSPDFVKCVP